jgi:hypothetical protein
MNLLAALVPGACTVCFGSIAYYASLYITISIYAIRRVIQDTDYKLDWGFTINTSLFPKRSSHVERQRSRGPNRSSRLMACPAASSKRLIGATAVAMMIAVLSGCAGGSDLSPSRETYDPASLNAGREITAAQQSTTTSPVAQKWWAVSLATPN